MHRTLIIGMGGRGARWARTVHRHDRFVLAGIADTDPAKLAERGDEFEIPEECRHTDFKEALSSSRYDVSIVVTPHHLHYDVSKGVLLAGTHCLTEKPFTLEMAHAEELVALAEEQKKVLQVAQNFRFNPLSQFVEEFIRDKRLGRLSVVEGSFHIFRPPRRPEECRMPFPLLFTQGIHHLDWLAWVLPAPIISISALHRRPEWSQWENPAICHVALQCEDGVLVNYSGSYESQGEVSTFSGLWRFEFEEGDLIIGNDECVRQVTGRGESDEIVFRPSANARTGDDCLLDQLHEAIEAGVEPPTSGRNNLKTLKLLFDVISGCCTNRHSDKTASKTAEVANMTKVIK